MNWSLFKIHWHLALNVQNGFSTDYGSSDHKEENWLCCQFCISRPHPSLATPIFVVYVHTKMRVVENFGQLSKVMYKNMRLHFADLGNTLQVPNLQVCFLIIILYYISPDSRTV